MADDVTPLRLGHRAARTVWIEPTGTGCACRSMMGCYIASETLIAAHHPDPEHADETVREIMAA